MVGAFKISPMRGRNQHMNNENPKGKAPHMSVYRPIRKPLRKKQERRQDKGAQQ